MLITSLQKLKNKKEKLIARISAERVKSTEKFRQWCDKGMRGYRQPDFDKKLDELKSKLEVVEKQIELFNQ